MQRKINTTNVETLAEFPKLRLSFNRFEEMISSGNFRILEKRTQSDLRPEKACKPPQEIASQECSFYGIIDRHFQNIRAVPNIRIKFYGVALQEAFWGAQSPT